MKRCGFQISKRMKSYFHPSGVLEFLGQFFLVSYSLTEMELT